MSTHFPYEKSFINQLTMADKHPQTIAQYQLTLTDFFNYQQHFNETFATSGLLADLTENDIKVYLAMLKNQRGYQQSTINKSLSNLTGYFNYLFEHRIITTLPTFGVKGQPLTSAQQLSNWPEQLADWLANDDLHVYTRACLLFTSKAYEASEMLAPDFYQDLAKLNFSTSEHIFLSKFKAYIEPLQSQYQTKALFLKTRRRGPEPQLSLSALHKYLTGDSQRLGVPLKPVALYQQYILWYLRQHRLDEPTTIMQTLRLDATSLGYYQNLLRRQDLRTLKANQ
ncbi:phage integrase N-terminal SAM-like domain-containing protein [Lactiplantibacillus mudanjiangensis]|uniref:Integrase [Lactobacillus sp.] n=1 Tax=Lactiplantibacillus mudanjiangensis TaxID=1296538 RepID=A0A660DWG7_9LACO|nr:phage integrase N-terminal SAM-like domain-containing protein [Lactiplantibacillus mudanjiangensis]VDG19419.1 integrase [Lactobacillus sp.] [Lactiplantibacillus mudanjiangensis]VDG25010.1 integrase [Lactobacillus sp.] [Lactiplantibacillus mudanjiangensis]VDG28000.1 integrase [Lactobacillus sp.] [Lactiplantibacillus mudanjiangensis]VDG30875.1 integrase [Lactobacillus sp.] [Lactiplantibacillus mudanjiangensis]